MLAQIHAGIGENAILCCNAASSEPELELMRNCKYGCCLVKIYGFFTRQGFQLTFFKDSSLFQWLCSR